MYIAKPGLYLLYQKASEYEQEMSQSHSADEEEPQNINSNKTSGRQLKQSNQLALPCQDAYKRRKDTKYSIPKQRPNTEPPQTMGVTQNNKSTTTEPPPKSGQQPKPLGCA